MDITILGQVFLGLTLAATAGLRAWLPLLALSVLGHLDVIPLNEQLAWLASPTAIVVLAIATVLEIAADKIPAVDHAMDTLGVVIRPIAGAMAMSAAIADVDPLIAITLGIAAGGTSAEVVELSKATTRVVANVTSFGIGGRALSIAEDGLAIGGIILGLLIPLIIGFFVAVLTIVGILSLPKLLRAFRQRQRRTQSPSPS
ncbi:MAG: DUF4126 domain-containing protein [Cyanobacteria bacterium P01_E01_bin.45]